MCNSGCSQRWEGQRWKGQRVMSVTPPGIHITSFLGKNKGNEYKWQDIKNNNCKSINNNNNNSITTTLIIIITIIIIIIIKWKRKCNNVVIIIWSTKKAYIISKTIRITYIACFILLNKSLFEVISVNPGFQVLLDPWKKSLAVKYDTLEKKWLLQNNRKQKNN